MNRSTLQLTFNRNAGQCQTTARLSEFIANGYTEPIFQCEECKWIRLSRSRRRKSKGGRISRRSRRSQLPARRRLVKRAGVRSGQRVLDVACGTGVVSVTAARLGARVTGLDLTPELLERARENSRIARVEIDWHEGDVEKLPFGDADV